MNRRMALLLAAGALLSATPALARDIVADIVGQLEARGYDEITVSRTWLGRARIVARGARGTREIIVNPATGEILRDLSQGSGSGGGGLLEAGDDNDDDDDDKDDDKDRDDDHSGHGGGDDGDSSGSGSDGDD